MKDGVLPKWDYLRVCYNVEGNVVTQRSTHSHKPKKKDEVCFFVDSLVVFSLVLTIFVGNREVVC